MITQDMVARLRQADVVDPGGERIGTVGEVWLEEGSREPAWVSVRTGMFGMKESFVPLRGAEAGNDGLHVAVGRDQVKDAPRVDTDGELSTTEQDRLYRHYGMVPGPRQHEDRRQEGRQPGDRRHDQGRGQRARGEGREAELTRSEERLRVGTEAAATGQVRLRKYVVTEDQQVTVPVRHEEAHLEREPVAEGTTGDARIEEDARDVTLHAEQPVVGKETVPVERVRLAKETVTEEQTVADQVRKEQIEVEDTDREGTGRERTDRDRRGH